MSRRIALSLVSHTNVGKTTLARTLLGRDIGEVRDAPHVTEFADEHVLIELPDGAALCLWDTPGFGDTARLAKRLRSADRPLGWLLSQVWDRVADRPFWSTQQALRHVRTQSDVVLYLVNAAESPAAAGYVAPEMELLGWIGKPVLVLLNQLGAPRPAADEAAEVEGWRAHLAGQPLVRGVLPMDAFARCWVQELTLLHVVEAALEGDARVAMAGLRHAWAAQREAQFVDAMALVAASLARIAVARETVADSGRLRDAARRIGRALGIARVADDPATIAQQALAAALDAEVRDNTGALIALHGLRGQAEGEILQRVAAHFELRLPLPEGKAAALGGLLTGALTGLKADLATGGLTLGGGLLAGGVLGALGGAGAARAVNLLRGLEHGWAGWSDDALASMTEAALLRYLAVAHFGRGRGDWAAGESPPHWRAVVSEALAPHGAALAAIWRRRGDASALAHELQPLLLAATRSALRRLYPGAAVDDGSAQGSR
jgi:hypothetical protein